MFAQSLLLLSLLVTLLQLGLKGYLSPEAIGLIVLLVTVAISNRGAIIAACRIGLFLVTLLIFLHEYAPGHEPAALAAILGLFVMLMGFRIMLRGF
jgi:hypothetical protein